ncbi:uncharacterized protein LOC144924994 isoform X2 [Branchiostoma floridae x Branchiostoma belcheri]
MYGQVDGTSRDQSLRPCPKVSMAGCGCDVRACRSELRLDNFRLDFHNPYVFVKSQWSWHPAVFVTYRVLVAVYLAGVACFDGVYHGVSLDQRYKVPPIPPYFGAPYRGT